MSETIYSFADARANLANLINKVVDDHTPAIVRAGRSGSRKEVVIVSKEDYSSLEETALILGNSIMAERIERAMKAVDEGRTFKVSEEDLLKALEQ